MGLSDEYAGGYTFNRGAKMNVAVCEPIMAKAHNESVRLDGDIMRKARVVAAIKDVAVSKYLADLLRPLVDRDHRNTVADEAKGLDKPKK